MKAHKVELREYKNGNKHWYKENRLHREDGPASEDSYGNKAWYQNGYLHRLDGPALEWKNGNKEWWIEGKQYTEEQFNKITNFRPLQGKKMIIDGHEYILS